MRVRHNTGKAGIFTKETALKQSFGALLADLLQSRREPRVQSPRLTAWLDARRAAHRFK
jgi:hypothetical protein